MAGDWIKMRTDIYRDPKVCMIADHLMDDASELSRHVNNACRRDMTVTRNVMRNATGGALVTVWGVMRHRGKRSGDDLVVQNATVAIVDDIADIPGFGDAMEAVGWLRESEEGIVFPNFFEEFNVEPGEDCKKSNAERQRRFRERRNALRNVTVTSQSNDREEKRRIEKSRDTNTNTLSSVPSERVSSATKKLEPWDEEVFAQFWSRYPRPVGKKVAHTAFTKAYLSLAADDRIPTRDAAQRIVDRAMEFAKSSRGKEQQYLPHPSTWLNQGRYLDNPTLWKESADSDGVPSLQEIFGGDFND